MCGNAALAGASLGLQALGGLTSASAAQSSASAQKSTLLLQAGLSDLNAKAAKDTADLNAKSVTDVAQFNASSILQAADINARIAETTAQQTLLSGQRDEQKSRLATANLRSSQRASMAANGIVLDEGTAANITTSTDLMGEVDAQTIHQNAIKQAWGYRTQSALDSNKAQTSAALVLAQGASQALQFQTKGTMDALNYSSQGAYSRSSGNAVNPSSAYTNSLLGSAGSVASSWYSFKKNGAFS